MKWASHVAQIDQQQHAKRILNAKLEEKEANLN
jgi:hypothetical protein